VKRKLALITALAAAIGTSSALAAGHWHGRFVAP
jgi:hypothetical protein